MLAWIKNLFLPRVVGYRPCWLKEQLNESQKKKTKK
jgi:hypothetical protein